MKKLPLWHIIQEEKNRPLSEQENTNENFGNDSQIFYGEADGFLSQLIDVVLMSRVRYSLFGIAISGFPSLKVKFNELVSIKIRLDKYSAHFKEGGQPW